MVCPRIDINPFHYNSFVIHLPIVADCSIAISGLFLLAMLNLLQNNNHVKYHSSSKMSRSFERRRSTQQERGCLDIDLQMNLLNTWTRHRVADYYQAIFLAHLDELPPAAAEESVKQEIRHTMQKRTLFFALQALNNQRKNLLMQLQQHFCSLPRDIGEELEAVCSRVKLVREVNLEIAEAIIKMHQQFRCNNKDAENQQMREYVALIDDLQSSVAFIRDSALRKHIQFGEGFDPFFMSSYEQVHRDGNSPQAVKQFYSLGISDVYRLMKAKSRLVDLRAAYEQPSPHKRQRRQTYKFENLPTLQAEHFSQPKGSENSRNRVIAPIVMLPSKQQRFSRTTVHPNYEQRPQSSFTEQYSRPKMKLSEVVAHEGDESNRSMRSKVKKNIVYLRREQEQKRSAKKYQLDHDQKNLESSLYPHQRQYSLPGEPANKISPSLPYKFHAASHPQRIQDDLSKINKVVVRNENRAETAPAAGLVVQMKNYNPIKGESFEISLTPRNNNKYDYIPHKNWDHHRYQRQQPAEESRGLELESPIFKYNRKNHYFPIQAVRQNQKMKIPVVNHPNHQKTQRIDQQIQTIETKQVIIKQSKNQRREQEVVQRKDKKPNKAVLRDKDDQTIENEDIIDERPALQQPKRPLIREASREQSPSKKAVNSPIRKNEVQRSTKSEEKREIKVKVGKSTIIQVLALLQKSQILPQYKALFDKEKLVPWIKASQTYLTEFHINGSCAVIALCSPIPNVGTALKLWAPLSGSASQSVSMNLFPKYIEYIEKSTTAEKIMYNGDGQLFKQLKACGFTLRKEKAYERARELPPKNIQSQFEPFLYVECSTVNFAQGGKQSVIFSQEIEEFNEKNCYLAKFIGEISTNTIPEGLKPFIKVSQNVPSFKEVNKILASQSFDEYEAGQVKSTNINLLRLYFNSPLKSTFLAGDGYIKLVGALLYQSGQQCLIAISTIKNNGVMLFAKNMSFDSILEKSKLNSNTRASFSVKMFTKKLYGKLAKFATGIYGNFEINLTYEDEMQGRIKHNLIIDRCFGPDEFTIGLQIQKCRLFCVTVREDDFIF